MKTFFHNCDPLALEAIPFFSLEEWRQWTIHGCLNHRGRILALFAVPQKEAIRLFGVLGFDTRGEMQVASTELPADKPCYSSLTPELPQAQGFERELAEQHGIHPEGHPWLKPIRKITDYPFYRVEGNEVHEVAVGPVHAGIIEPGHFRFQCHGERILNLEIQLGYQHRGIEKMMRQADPNLQAVLSESIAGDTVMGHATAHAQAMEALAGLSIPLRAAAIRAMALEIERLANHAGDLGALSNDIGFLPAAAWFGRLRGEFLNLLMELSGNRFGRGLIRPGGILFDVTRPLAADFKRRLSAAGKDLRKISAFFFETSAVRARLDKTGIVSEETAKAFELVGPVARAANMVRDVRHDYPMGAYQSHFLLPVRLSSGDVYARARVRELEARRSLEFLAEVLQALPNDGTNRTCGSPAPSTLTLSLVEGWRGEIIHIVKTDSRGALDFYKIVDPSFRNWPALALAMREGEMSDFPLCNKSFNLSYAGHDL